MSNFSVRIWWGISSLPITVSYFGKVVEKALNYEIFPVPTRTANIKSQVSNRKTKAGDKELSLLLKICSAGSIGKKKFIKYLTEC